MIRKSRNNNREFKKIGLKNEMMWIFFRFYAVGFHGDLFAGSFCQLKKNAFLCDNKNKYVMSLNKVILIGNVGRDPEVRYFDNGRGIANFPLATSERGYTLANGTVVPERTEWHNIVVRSDLVPFVEKWVKKGSGLYVEGKIRTRSYDDQAGNKRYITEIYADRVAFYNNGTRPAEQQSSVSSDTAAQQTQPYTAVSLMPNTTSFAEPGEIDDLPF